MATEAVALDVNQQSITVLGGGTGTPKLLWDLGEVVTPERLSVVANTGDDIAFGDLFVTPDVDSCLFAGAGRIDTDRWWGLATDTTETADALDSLTEALGLSDTPLYRPASAQTGGRHLTRWRRFAPVPEFMTLGDEDRAIHRARMAAIDLGRSLTAVTRDLAAAIGCPLTVLPMSNDPVATLVHTPDDTIHFQEYWVARRGEVTIDGIEFRGSETANPTPAVREALRADRVVIGPSNPITSIGPILALSGVTEALDATTVVAVSPFLGDTAFSGPATALQAAAGHPVGSAGLAEAYPFLDGLILDAADPTTVDCETIRTDIRIDTPGDARRIWRAIDTVFDRLEDGRRG